MQLDIVLPEESNSFVITNNERKVIESKTIFELNEMQFKMIKIGGVANIVSGIFILWILGGQIPRSLLITWYLCLVIANLLNIAFSYLYKFYKVTPKRIKPWLSVYHLLVAMICLVWGSMGILFVTNNIYQELYIIAFLLAVIVGFGIGTITDFKASVISISCLLIPYISFHSYLGIESILRTGADPKLYLGFSVMLLILGIFLIVTSYIGYKLIKRSILLSFENMLLTHKLENINKILEERVKERTIDLEKALTLSKFQATHDLLTELPNQRLLVKYMQAAIQTSEINHHQFAIMAFTLNEINKVYEVLGYETGNFVIKSVAKRFASLEKQYTITLSRHDTFIILIKEITDQKQIQVIAEEFFALLVEPLQAKNLVLKLTASVGISIYPKHGEQIATLLMNTDAAMLRAKAQGGNSYMLYEPSFNQDLSKKLEMEIQLQTAMQNNEFILHYQPFIDLSSGKICGSEALIRWQSPIFGLVPPIEFISLIEMNGLMNPVLDWTLKTACSQNKIWQDLGFTNLKIAINLSARQLYRKDILQIIANILQTTQLNPASLELELTETEAFNEEMIPILKNISQLGLSISIDDFGTGYSGLTNLKLFKINKIKIDQSFIRDVVTSQHSQTIVRNIIALAKRMEIIVLAEGVETIEQLAFLQENGCDMVQGFYYSRAVDEKEFSRLLAKNKFLI